MRLLLLSLILFLRPFLGLAEDKLYENQIYYHPALTDVAFFFGTVQPESDMILKRALKSEPQTKVLVLASLGGSLYGGIRASGIIKQAGLDTYVPEGVACLSACSSMFFAGKNRWVKGELGVHQFRSVEVDEEVLAGVKKVESDAQYAISDVITVLSDYDLPSFVLPRMLATHWTDMHIFTDTEKYALMKRNNASKPQGNDCIEKISRFIMDVTYSTEGPEDTEATMPTCQKKSQGVIKDNTQLALSGVANVRDGLYEILDCRGALSSYLASGSINISDHRQSFNGRNVSITESDGAELMFGSPRVYNTNAGDLISESSSESMLLDGIFEPITLALIADNSGQKFSDLVVVSAYQKTVCALE